MTGSRQAKFLLVQALTFGRVPLILVFLVVTLAAETRESGLWFAVAFGAMVLSALTDTFDGLLARRFKVTSTLGAHADPLTDKIFYLTVFPTLVYLACDQRECPEALGDLGPAFHAPFLLILTILFLLRDQWVSFLRAVGALHKIDAKSNWAGKLRTAVSFPVLCTVYYYLQMPEGFLGDLLPVYRWPFLVYLLEGLCLAINLVSIWVYTARYWPAVKREGSLRGE